MHVDAQHAQINSTLLACFELNRLHKYTQSFNFKCAGLLNQALDVMFPVSEELPHTKRTRVSRYEVISFTGSSLVCRQLRNDCQMLIPCEMRQKIKRGNVF